MNMGEKIRQARKEKGISQEALAEQMGLSVQAVSKWECDLSCPDIALLPKIADFLEVSLDYLLRNEENSRKAEKTAQVDLPDDNTLRIVQFIGRKMVSQEEWKNIGVKDKIPLSFEEAWKSKNHELPLNVEIWGSADIDGAISGNVTAGGGINCDCVGNDACAGGGINCDCVGNNATAGGSINCDHVGNNVCAGSTVNCDSVGNNVSAGASVTCGDIRGNVRCEGEIHCHTIEGDVTGGSIFMDN